MTGQIPDKYRYKSKEYNIVALSDPIGFYPEDYGLEPEAPHTACWRGYVCEYEIGDELILKRFKMYNSKGKYPEFNGIHAFGGVYETNMKLDYTGKIVLGDGFIRDYYIHMGFQRPWAYKELKEFIFKSGKLIEVIDHSEFAEKLREEIKKNAEGFYEEHVGGLIDYVYGGFSLDMKTKAWWIE